MNFDYGLWTSSIWTWDVSGLPTQPLHSLSLRLLKLFFDNALLENGASPCCPESTALPFGDLGMGLYTDFGLRLVDIIKIYCMLYMTFVSQV